MIKEDIYKYFILEAHLYAAIMNWIRNIRKDTLYDNLPYTIENISSGNGLIYLTIFYYTGSNTKERVDYSINIKELENY